MTLESSTISAAQSHSRAKKTQERSLMMKIVPVPEDEGEEVPWDFSDSDRDDEPALSDENGLESLLCKLSIERPSQLPNGMLSRVREGSSTQRNNSLSAILAKTFAIETTTPANLILDVSSSPNHPVVLYATRMKLVELLTSTLDYKLMDDFLMTVEMIMEPSVLGEMIMSRLAQACGAVHSSEKTAESVNRDVVKMRCLIVLQHWAHLNAVIPPQGPSKAQPYLAPGFDPMLIKFIVDALDFILIQGRYVSDADRKFLVKIRRIYDPKCIYSPTAAAISPVDGSNCLEDRMRDFVETRVMDATYGDSSLEEPGNLEMGLDGTAKPAKLSSKSWRSRFRGALRAIFRKHRGLSSSGALLGDASLSSTGSSASSSIASIPLQRHHTRRHSQTSTHSVPSPNMSSAGSLASDLESMELTPILLSERSKTLARIFTALESDMIADVGRGELAAFPRSRASIDGLYASCPQLQRHIEHFNSMCRWFARQIADPQQCPASLNQQAELLAKMIRLGVKALLLHNYSTAMQIVLALQAPAVSGNASLWASLPPWERQLAKDLLAFGSPARNFRHVRRAQEEVLGEEAGVVPFLGLFLSDLVMNWERPEQKQTAASSSSSALIPFYKNHLAAKIIRLFRAFQAPSVAQKSSQKRQNQQQPLSQRERQLYSYFADVGRLGGEFM